MTQHPEALIAWRDTRTGATRIRAGSLFKSGQFLLRRMRFPVLEERCRYENRTVRCRGVFFD